MKYELNDYLSSIALTVASRFNASHRVELAVDKRCGRAGDSGN